MIRSRALGVLLAAVLLAGCSSNLISGTAERVPPDSRDAFSVFDRPPAPGDQVPEWFIIDPDPPDVMQAQLETRRVARTPDFLIWIGHAPLYWICLMVSTDPRRTTSGLSSCTKGYNAAEGFQGMRWSTGDNEDQHNPAADQTVLLIPDGETATLHQGKIVIIGNGVLVAEGETINITLTDPIGATRTFVGRPPPR